MRRAYEKPVMTVERFLANVAVASCTPSTTIKPVHVDCLIKSGDVDGVFYSGGCDYVASDSNLITLNGHQYLYWYGSSSGTPEVGGTKTDGTYYGQKLMTELKNAGISQNGAGGVLHAGLATAEVLSVINSSI